MSRHARRAITPATLLLAMEQLSRERTLCSQLAALDVTFTRARRTG
ncbi:MAG: hypothetical protein AB7T06_11280 [Kofleriaceae bacterium]